MMQVEEHEEGAQQYGEVADGDEEMEVCTGRMTNGDKDRN